MIPTFNIILYTQRPKKDDKYPVKVRVIFLGKHKDFRTGLDLTKEEFKEANILNPKKKHQEIRKKLDAIKIKIDDVTDRIGPFTFQKFHDGFYGRMKDASDIFPFFEEYIANLNFEGQLKTATNYKTVMNSLKRFRPTIGFHDIDEKLLRAYHKWLATTPVSEDKPGRSETTVSIYMRTLRSIYNYAISKGVIKMTADYPFGKRKYVIPASKNVKKALPLEQVGLIYNYETVPYGAEDRARDFWIFSYLCGGINFKDIALLKRSSIDGKMLRFVRAKTKRSMQSSQTIISCPITDQVKNVIDKWQGPKRSKDSYLFPIVEDGDSLVVQQKKIDQFIKTTNKYMNRICENLKFDKKVTTYFSRHSYATIMLRGGASTEQISEALGHKSLKTTKNYLASFDDDSKFALVNKLTDF